MNYPNTPQLKKWLTEAGFHAEAGQENFEFAPDAFRLHLRELRSRPEAEQSDAAAFRCLTFDKSPRKPVPNQAELEAVVSRLTAELGKGVAFSPSDDISRLRFTTEIALVIDVLKLLTLLGILGVLASR